ncbi:MAG TPA: hypothetical protein VGS58_14475 [Candidatus Sulfopaludibacter sp.]|nr:hypothetical protein [Candidatus Sulfopaludibacter sp.]
MASPIQLHLDRARLAIARGDLAAAARHYRRAAHDVPARRAGLDRIAQRCADRAQLITRLDTLREFLILPEDASGRP